MNTKSFFLRVPVSCRYPRTRIVSVTHVSNVLGTINPVDKLIEIAHAHNVPVLIDGAQSIPHLSVDVQALDADFYVFSGHKVYGPTGIGVLYGKEDWRSTVFLLIKVEEK